mgnify:CR=1 FL=1
MADLRCDESAACGIVTTGSDRLSLQKRTKNLIYINTAYLPYYCDINGNDTKLEGVHKVRELGIKCTVNAPACILCLDYPRSNLCCKEFKEGR